MLLKEVSFDFSYPYFWEKLKMNRNNGYHPYHTHEAGTKMVTSEESINGVRRNKGESIEAVM